MSACQHHALVLASQESTWSCDPLPIPLLVSPRFSLQPLFVSFGQSFLTATSLSVLASHFDMIYIRMSSNLCLWCGLVWMSVDADDVLTAWSQESVAVTLCMWFLSGSGIV